jgi:DNA-binding transcriptional MerR regulator
MNGNGRLTVQEMAEQSGVSAHTLRYYERIGLLQPVARTPSGHRRYAADDLGWVRLLVCLRETGMGIRDMLRFVAVDGGELSVAERRLALLEAHRDAVRAHQQEVAAHLAVIEGKLDYYRSTLREAEPLGEIGDGAVMRANGSVGAS